MSFSLLLGALSACGSDPPLPSPLDLGPAPDPIRPPTIARFEALTATVSEGEPARLEWAVTEAEAVELRSDRLGFRIDVPLTGTATTPALDVSTRFILSAEGPGGVSLAEVAIAVVAPPEPAAIESFEAFPERFEGAGADIRLSWRAEGELRLFANRDPLDFPGQETTFWTVYVRAPTLFTLVAERDGRSVERSVQVRRSGVELEPNDERGSAGFLDRDGRAVGSIGRSGDVDWYAVDVPEGGNLFAEVTNGARGCDFDSQLELWGPDPERPGQIRFLALADDAGGRSCARLDPADEPRALEMLAGRHYLTVRGFDARAVGPYELNVLVAGPECGNGLVEPSRGENCDAVGPGCADCQLVFEGDMPFRGPDASETRPASLVPGRDRFFEILLEREAVVGARLRDGDGRCPTGLELALLDPLRSGGSTALVLDDGRRSDCGELRTASRPAGRYVLRARSAGPLVQPRVSVRIATPGCGDGLRQEGVEACDDGNLSDDDGCSSTCEWSAVATATATPIRLSVQDRSLRFVSVDVLQPGASVTASVAESVAEDVVLSLYDEDFERLGEAPSGAPLGAGSAFAVNLPRGRYSVGLRRVRPADAPIPLTVRAVSPECSDGILQTRANETCDDGNTLPGDGCDAGCRLELAAPVVELPDPARPLLGGRVPVGGALYFGIRTSTVVRLLSVRAGHPQVARCDAPADTDLRMTLLDETLREVIADEGTAFTCPLITQEHMGPGDAYLRLESLTGRSLDSVFVQIFSATGQCGDGGLDDNEACDDGNRSSGDGCSPSCRWEPNAGGESEPNDLPSEAEVLGVRVGGPVVERLGAIHTFDRDVYRFSVGRWQEVALTAKLVDSRLDPFCSVDTYLRLLDDRGQVVAENDNDPNRSGGCSFLELVGARRLFEGTYDLEVSAGPSRSRVPMYTLEVMLE